MIAFEAGVLVFGIAASLSWGIGDFCGGVAAKRIDAYVVTLLSQFIGGLGILILALFTGEVISDPVDLVYGAVAGLLAAAGLVLFYQSLATGRMGIVAPVAAVVTAMVPIIFSLFTLGLPTMLQIGGFILALIGVWLVSANGNGSRIEAKELLHPVLTGISFGLFFILIGRVSADAIYWPLVAARTTSVTVLTAVVLITKRQWMVVDLKQWAIIFVVGVTDITGNVFYVLSTKAGRLDIAAVLSSLYPAATVLLARIFLKEDINSRQWIGLMITLAAVILLAI